MPDNPSLTLLTGALQLGVGLARMGALVNFISHPFVIGFAAGAAVLIVAAPIRTAIYPRLDPEICRACRERIFRQCHIALPSGETRAPGAR